MKSLKKVDEHTFEVIKKAVPSFFVKILGMFVGFAISVFIGRTLGPEGLGTINLANKIVAFIVVIAMLGMPNVIIKNVAISYFEKDYFGINNNMFTAFVINGSFAFILSILIYFLSDYISNSIFHNSELKVVLVILTVGVLPQTFSRIFASGLSGQKKIWQSNLVNNTLSSWYTGIILLILYSLNCEFSVITFSVAYLLGRLFVTLTVGIYWNRLIPYPILKSKIIGKQMLTVSLPLLLVTATTMLASSSATFFLGIFEDTRQVGLFSAASRLALLSLIFLQITNSALSPKIASMFKHNQIQQMEIMVQKVTFALFILGIISLMIFVFFGNYVLSIWGLEFREAYGILIIMSLGQFINISTGASGLTLIMCGFEKIQMKISIFYLIFNAISSFLLTYLYGMYGAAIAFSITISAENITKVIITNIKVGILIIPKFRNIR